MSREKVSAIDSDDESSSGTNSSSEDADPEDPMEEKEFFKTLSALKSQDPKIYDGGVEFFKDSERSSVKSETQVERKRKRDKVVTLWEHERNVLTADGVQKDDGAANQNALPYSKEQDKLKEQFKSALADSDSDDDAGALLRKKVKTEEEQTFEDKEYIEWLKGSKKELDDKNVEGDLKPLKDFWSHQGLDDGEAYLRDYILNRLYDKDEKKSVKVDDAELSEDGDLLEKQDNYESRYNLRFEDANNTEVKRYPRQIGGSLRKKDDSRKRKRAELRQRKRDEKVKKHQEVAVKQKEKLAEIKEHLEKLKKATGNEQLAFPEDELLEDFDPEKHDETMALAYGDQFYAEDEQLGEKPTFSDAEDEGWDPENINMDCEGPSTSKPKESRSKKKRKKKALERGFSDLMAELGDGKRPEFEPTKYESFTKYLDEVYSLDCEDFIQDLPCKFKYRQVVANDFGLSVEEILAADDNELNQWASAKKITKHRPEHVENNEVKIYKKKGQDLNLKAKILSSVYKTEEDESTEKERDEGENEEEEENKSRGKSNNNGKRRSDSKKHKRFNKKISSSSANDDSISDSRLLAYAINPKQFKKKMKFKKLN